MVQQTNSGKSYYRDEFEGQAQLATKRSFDSIRKNLKEIQRNLEIWLDKIIGDLKGILSRDGASHYLMRRRQQQAHKMQPQRVVDLVKYMEESLFKSVSTKQMNTHGVTKDLLELLKGARGALTRRNWGQKRFVSSSDNSSFNRS